MDNNEWFEQITKGIVVSTMNSLCRQDGVSYLELTWLDRKGRKIKVRDMPRDYVQNCLHWCATKNAGANDDKDGILYRDWIVYFTMRLLDPNLE